MSDIEECRQKPWRVCFYKPHLLRSGAGMRYIRSIHDNVAQVTLMSGEVRRRARTCGYILDLSRHATVRKWKGRAQSYTYTNHKEIGPGPIIFSPILPEVVRRMYGVLLVNSVACDNFGRPARCTQQSKMSLINNDIIYEYHGVALH